MTDPSPYQPVPLDIPAGHPLLDASGFTDLRALAEAGPSGAQLAAALQVIASAGISVADVTDPDSVRALLSHGSYSGPALPPGLAELLNAPSATASARRDRTVGPRCHRCDAPATVQWNRLATEREAEDWHAGREQHIRAHNDGREAAGYVADRSDTVVMAVFGCGDHDLSPAPADDANAAEYEARQIGADRRALLHAADCGGHGACECGGGK